MDALPQRTTKANTLHIVATKVSLPPLPTAHLFVFYHITLAEGHGNLWLVAAAGAALSIPYHMLLMSAPVATAIDNSSAPASSSAATSPAAAPLLDSKHDLESSSTVVPPPKPAQRRADRQLAYVQSGVLISPETASSSWTRKYWFGAALSCAAFAGMMSIMASRREAAAISGHNFTF